MPYPYGTNSGPTGRLAAPGLPRRVNGGAVADPLGFPAKFILARTDQAIRIPDWVQYVRMGATGKGGDSVNRSATPYYGGAGGAGFAGTAVVRAVPGALIYVRLDPTGMIVEGLGYRLIGGRGADGTTSSGGTGGLGSGGDVNFSGGNGAAPTGSTSGSGGSAAGRGGAGISASTGSTQGPSGSPGSGYLSGAAPGGSSNTSLPGLVGSSGAQSVGSALITVATPQPAGVSDGGDGGGGAGSNMNTNGASLGGAAFALIEFW